jgi:all-trans-retinol 13,14-reductase
MKAVIIGSGMAGLTAGAYLAHAGHTVTLYEQFPEPGGVTATLHQDGFSWDLGPLLLDGFAPGDTGTRILEDLGVADQIRVLRSDRGIVFPDFNLWKPEQYQGPYWRRERLKELFPHEARNLDRFYKFYDQVIHLFSLAKQAEGKKGWPALREKMRLLWVFYPLNGKVEWTAQRLMDDFFKRQELKALFTAILADFVTKPSEFPALGVPSLNFETAFDIRIPAQPGTLGPPAAYSYILGGCGELVSAVLRAYTRAGGTIHTSSAVSRIVVEDDAEGRARARGVILQDGSFDAADVVIASGGAQEIFTELVGKEHLPADFLANLAAVRWMESVLMVQLGIDFDPTPYQRAALCYYYGTYDIEGAVDRIRQGIYHEGKEGFLIYIPSMHSPEMAPLQNHALTLYTVAPDTLANGSWSDRREELADKLVAEAEHIIPGLHQHTVTRVILTPEEFRTRTHQKHHSFGGIPPVISNKLPPHKTPVEGLWFIGAQSESRGGVVNVMNGAAKTAKQILQS